MQITKKILFTAFLTLASITANNNGYAAAPGDISVTPTEGWPAWLWRNVAGKSPAPSDLYKIKIMTPSGSHSSDLYKIKIMTPSGSHSYEIFFRYTDTIADLKKQIEDKYAIPVGSQIIQVRGHWGHPAFEINDRTTMQKIRSQNRERDIIFYTKFGGPQTTGRRPKAEPKDEWQNASGSEVTKVTEEIPALRDTPAQEMPPRYFPIEEAPLYTKYKAGDPVTVNVKNYTAIGTVQAVIFSGNEIVYVVRVIDGDEERNIKFTESELSDFVAPEIF